MNVLLRNNVKTIGTGKKTIVFGHGFGCDQNMWRFVVPHFEKEYRIVLFDHVGSGRSDWTAFSNEKYKSLHSYASDLLEIFAELKIEKATFVGHSVSSMIGMLASIEKPQLFENIVMIGPSPCYVNKEPDYHGGFDVADINELLDMMELNFVGWASYFAPIAMNTPEKPVYSEELEDNFCATNPAITRRFAEVTFFSDHRADLKDSTVPTLILQCSEDSIVPFETGEFLHKNLINSTFTLMEAKGHYPHLSHPEETVRHIKRYLQLTEK